MVCYHPQDPNLLSNSFQNPQHFLVTLYKSKLGVFKTLFFGEFFDEQTGGPQIMTREAREKMVCHLQMKATMNKLDRRIADDIRCRSQLSINKRLGRTKIRRRARKV